MANRLTQNRRSVLEFLASSEDKFPGRYMAHLPTPAVRALENMGYVECQEDDQRGWRITPAGLAAIGHAQPQPAPEAEREDREYQEVLAYRALDAEPGKDAEIAALKSKVARLEAALTDVAMLYQRYEKRSTLTRHMNIVTWMSGLRNPNDVRDILREACRVLQDESALNGKAE